MPEVDILIRSSAADAVAGFHETSAAAKIAESDVEDVGRSMHITADGADELGGKAGKATGALGALSSGFDLVGLENYSAGLQGAAMATDFLGGAGDALNLVMESTIAKTVASKVATVASAVATKALAAGTAVMTAGQWALNAAMSANPIGLAVAAAVALAAGFLLLYRRSATVRDIVREVGEVGREAIGWVVDRGEDLVDGIQKVGEIAGDARVLVVKAFGAMKDKAEDVGEAILAPFEKIIDIVDDIIDAIGKIHVPDLPSLGDLNPFRAVGGGGFPAGATGGVVVQVQLPNGLLIGTVDELVDKLQTALGRQLRLTAS